MKKRLRCALALSVVASGAGPTWAAELVLQSGGGGVGRGAVISRDGHWLAKGGLDLWDAWRGELVRRMATGTQEDPLALTPLQFSPDGRLLLSQVRDNYGATKYVSLRLVPSLRETHRLRFIEPPLFCDGRVVRGVFGSDLKEWSARTGRLLVKRPLQQAPLVDKLARSTRFTFSRNGRFLAFGGASGEPVRIWDARSGRLRRAFKESDANSGDAVVSDDGRWLAVTQVHESTLQVSVWDVKASRLRLKLDEASGASFSADGRSLWTWVGDGAAQWRLSDGRRLRTLPAINHPTFNLPGESALWPVARSDGSTNELRLYDVASGRLARTLPGDLGGASPLAWSPDGKYLAGGNDLQAWDVKAGALLGLASSTYVQRLRWKDSETLQTENGQQAREWRVRGRPPYLEAASTFAPRFPPPEQGVQLEYNDSVFVSPDGALALTNAPDYDARGTLYVWNTRDGALSRSIKVVGYPQSPSVAHETLEPRWQTDNQGFQVWKSGKVETWNARTGLLERSVTLELPAGWPLPEPLVTGTEPGPPLYPLALSPDGRHAAAVSAVPGQRGVGIWKLSDGSLQRVLPTRNQRNGAFSSDGRTLMVAEFGRDAELWEWQGPAEKPLRVLDGSSVSGDVNAPPAWSPDNSRIALSTGDYISIYDTQTGHLTVRLSTGGTPAARDASDWIAWTPEGFYNASPRGEARFRWREGDLLLPRGASRDLALRRKLRRPQIIARALGAR